MDNYYDEKQHYRQKHLNSRRDSHQIDDRRHKKLGNKQLKLVQYMMDDFHPDHSRDSYQCIEVPVFHSAISKNSDDGMNDYQEMIAQENENDNNIFSATTMEISTNPVPDIANFADCITTDKQLSITPLNQQYKNYLSMENKCRPAKPGIDTSILNDFQRAFNNPSPVQLLKIIQCCQTLPYSIRSKDGAINEIASKFMLDHKLTENQLFRVHKICQNILYRSSYGVLFLQNNKFFAKTTGYNTKRRSAIKGYSLLKSNGEWENPWETTVRITKQDVEYWNSENQEWQLFDMDEQIEEDERRIYLEYLVKSIEKTTFLRYIGIFVIRLNPNIQIRVKDPRKSDINGNWYHIDMENQCGKFYTINPFLQYLRQHRD